MMLPTTFSMTLVVLGLLVVGAGLIFFALLGSARERESCPREGCGHRNPPGARYCGRCGAPLDDEDHERGGVGD